MAKTFNLILSALIVAALGLPANAFQVVKLSSEVTGTLPAANGGTGVSSVGTTGNVLTSTGSAWASSAPSGGASNSTIACSSSLPSATGSGKAYWCNDSPAVFIDDPNTNSLIPFASEYMWGTPGSFTGYGNIAVNATSGTAFNAIHTVGYTSDTGSALRSSASLGTSSAWSVAVVCTLSIPTSSSYPWGGVAVADGNTVGSSNVYSFYIYEISGDPGIGYSQHALGGARISAPAFANTQPDIMVGGSGRYYFRYLNDKTLLHLQISHDGIQWMEWYGVSTPSSLSYYGVTVGNDYSGATGSEYAQMPVYGITLNTSLTQQNITGATGSGVPIQLTMASTSGFKAGDLVSISGMVGNTAANVSTGAATSSSRVVKSVDSSTQLTLAANSTAALTGNGTWTSGGIITLLSR